MTQVQPYLEGVLAGEDSNDGHAHDGDERSANPHDEVDAAEPVLVGTDTDEELPETEL